MAFEKSQAEKDEDARVKAYRAASLKSRQIEEERRRATGKAESVVPVFKGLGK